MLPQYLQVHSFQDYQFQDEFIYLGGLLILLMNLSARRASSRRAGAGARSCSPRRASATPTPTRPADP